MKTIRAASLLAVGAVVWLPPAAFGSDKDHCYLRDASAPTAATAFLLCEQGLVYATADSGATWTPRATGAAQVLHAISFSDATHGFVVGDGGTLLATGDGAKTWQPRTSGTPEHLLAAFSLGNLAWASGFDGTMLHSIDGGRTWAKQDSGTTMSLESIFFLDPDHGWAVGWSGTILRTENGGKAWQLVTTDAASWSLAAVRFRDPKNGWAVGFAGQLLRSKDGGLTWEAQKSPTTSWLTSVAFDKGNRLWIAADDKILLSDDAGDTWRALPVDQNQFVARVFPLGNTMWALGELGLMKQTATGLQWKRDEAFVPAGAQIATTLEDTTAAVSTGKSK